MSKVVNLHELRILMGDDPWEAATQLNRDVEHFLGCMTKAAEAVAAEHGIVCDEADWEEEGGPYVAFSPKTADQPMPKIFESVDPSGDWEVARRIPPC